MLPPTKTCRTATWKPQVNKYINNVSQQHCGATVILYSKAGVCLGAWCNFFDLSSLSWFLWTLQTVVKCLTHHWAITMHLDDHCTSVIAWWLAYVWVCLSWQDRTKWEIFIHEFSEDWSLWALYMQWPFSWVTSWQSQVSTRLWEHSHVSGQWHLNGLLTHSVVLKCQHLCLALTES